MRASATTSPQAAAARFRRALGALVVVFAGVATVAERCPAAAVVVAQTRPATPPAPTVAPAEDQPKNGEKLPENVEPLPSSDATAVLGKKVKGAERRGSGADRRRPGRRRGPAAGRGDRFRRVSRRRQPQDRDRLESAGFRAARTGGHGRTRPRSRADRGRARIQARPARRRRGHGADRDRRRRPMPTNDPAMSVALAKRKPEPRETALGRAAASTASTFSSPIYRRVSAPSFRSI